MKKGKKYICHECGKENGHYGYCYECKNVFCYDHLYCLNYSPERMRKIDRVRDLCNECKIKYNYITI